MKKYISYFLAICLIASLLIFPSQTNSKVAEAATISLKAKLTTLEVGSTTTLSISGTKKKVSWSSSNKSYVKVDTKGKVTAVKKGSATITATVSGKKLKLKINVVEKTALSCSTITLNVGKRDFVRVNGKDTGAIKTATWTTSAPKVASVDKTGVITGIKKGTATITASIHGKKYSCKVTVNDKIALSNTALTLTQGKTQALSFKNVKCRAIWSSNNKNVAYVSYDGIVTAVGKGTAIITGRIDGVDYPCKVTVMNLSSTNQTSQLVFVGDKTTKLALPANATGSVAWTSDNPSAVGVDNGTLNVIKVGSATITATIGTAKYTYFIVAVSAANPFVKVGNDVATGQSFGTLHFSTPKSWSYEGDVIEGTYEGMGSPTEDSMSYLSISITNTGKKAPDYYTVKKKFEKEFSLSAMKKELEDLLGDSDSGMKFSIANFKQVTLPTNIGNVLRTDVTMKMGGLSISTTAYSFVFDQYEVTVTVMDLGGNPISQNSILSIVNTFYVQN